MDKEGILLNSAFINKMNIGGEPGWFPVETNASTGYIWTCTPDDSGVYEIAEKIVLHPSTEAVGTPGMIIWKFKAIREGLGRVMFEQFPPGRTDAVETVIVEIAVK